MTSHYLLCTKVAHGLEIAPDDNAPADNAPADKAPADKYSSLVWQLGSYHWGLWLHQLLRMLQIQFKGMTIYDCGTTYNPKHPQNNPACTVVTNLKDSLRLQVSYLSTC